MTRSGASYLKFGVFALIMIVLTAFLIMTFGEYESRDTAGYSAVFVDSSGLKAGDSVRVAGIKVGSVDAVSLQDDKTVVVEFDVDRSLMLTTGTRAAVRYLNLVGDRYLEIVDGPGSTRKMPAGTRIPAERTEPALDLDALLGGLKPVIQGLNPQDVNALTSALVDVFQGQGDTLDSLLSKTSSFTNTLADNSAVMEQLIDNLNAAVGTISDDGARFSSTLERLHRLVEGLAGDRDRIGSAIESLSAGTASVSDLLGQARPPLATTVSELNRLAANLDAQSDRIETSIQKAPENYRKMMRLGSYGSFFNYYLCGITIRVSDLQNRTAVFPWIEQNGGRCTEPE